VAIGHLTRPIPTTVTTRHRTVAALQLNLVLHSIKEKKRGNKKLNDFFWESKYKYRNNKVDTFPLL
jgi:hypothetical protein